MKTTLNKAIGKIVKFVEDGYDFEVLETRNTSNWIAIRKVGSDSIYDFRAPWSKVIIV